MDDAGGPARSPSGARLWPTVAAWLHPFALVAAATFLAGALAGAAAMATTSPAALSGLPGASGDPNLFPDRLTTWTVFSNNVVALAVLATGAVTFGATTFLGLFLNGLLVGILVFAGAGESTLAWTLALLLPHGVLELGAFVVVGGAAYRVAWRVVAYLRGRRERALTRAEAVEAVVLLAVAVLGLAVAAWVEVQLTPEVARAVVGEPAG